MLCNSMLKNRLEQTHRSIHQLNMRSWQACVLSPCIHRMCFRLCSYIKGICYLYMVCNSMLKSRLEQMRRNTHHLDKCSLFLIDQSPYKYHKCFDSLACTVGIYHSYRVCNSMLWNQREQMHRSIHHLDTNNLYLIVQSLCTCHMYFR